MWALTIYKSQKRLKTPGLYPAIQAIGWGKTQLVHLASHHPMAFQGFVGCHVHLFPCSRQLLSWTYASVKRSKSTHRKRKAMKFLKIRNTLYFYNFTPSLLHVYFMLNFHTCLHLWKMMQFLVLDFPPTVLESPRNIFKITYWLLPQGRNLQEHKYPLFWS